MKLLLNKYPYQTIWFLASLVLTVISIVVYYESCDLEKNGQIKKYKITDKYCNKSFNRSSSIYFQTKEGVRSVEIPNYNICNSYRDYIELTYSSRFDYYYLPRSIWKYKRYIIGSALLLVFSVLPWVRIKKYINRKSYL